jgi:hypothetical protein
MIFNLYKIREQNYCNKYTNITAIIKHLNTTVSPHLQVSCFKEYRTLQTWIANLQAAVGVNLDNKIRRVQEQYYEALKLMRSPQN